MIKNQCIVKSFLTYLALPVIALVLVSCSPRSPEESSGDDASATTGVQKKDTDSADGTPTKTKCCEQKAKAADVRVAEDLLAHVAQAVSDGDAPKAEKALEELHRELSHQTENGPPTQNAAGFDEHAFSQLSRDLVSAIHDKRADARTRYDELRDFVAQILSPE